MKAMIIRRHGEPSVFRAAEIPVPGIGPSQVLVRVAATSVNPVDWKIRKLGPPLSPDLPAVLHGDVAGVVEAVGTDVDGLSVGGEVYGCAGGVKGSGGALAEFMACEADLLAPKPTNLSMVEAAALPLVCLTAWEGLVDGANVGRGQTVLVHAGAGGVGHVAIQIAVARQANVYATVSGPEKAAVVGDHGAIPINYRKQSVEAYVDVHTGGAGFDIVYDTVGGDNLPKSWAAGQTQGHGHQLSIQFDPGPHASTPKGTTPYQRDDADPVVVRDGGSRTRPNHEADHRACRDRTDPPADGWRTLRP